MAKDFIIDENQIIRSQNAGATVILLIVAALSETRLKELYDFATGLGLEVLLETHNLAELEVAHRIGAKIIGVNNRNLVTLKRISIQAWSYQHILKKVHYISESAILLKKMLSSLLRFSMVFLVGTTLMTAENVAESEGVAN